MKLPSKSLALAILVILFGGIMATTAMNWWITESSKVPAVYTEGEVAGEYNPADIRGSYTFGEISDLFEIPLSDLGAAFQIPTDMDAASFELKSLETLYAGLPQEIGSSSVRLFVALYKGLPYDLTSEYTFLLPQAVGILQREGQLSAEQEEYLKTHIVNPSSTAISEPALEETALPASTTAPTSEEATDRTVKGSTTFQNLLDWGVAQSEIEFILGESMPAAETVIKNYYTEKGLEFSTVKSALQAAVDAK
jgi:hypothetical protein